MLYSINTYYIFAFLFTKVLHGKTQVYLAIRSNCDSHNHDKEVLATQIGHN